MQLRRTSIARAACLGLLCAGLLAPEAQATPNNMVALGVGANANTLYRFSGETPGTVASVPATGLGLSTLVGIDFRPATQGLVGLGVVGDTTTLFAIDPTTGAATPIGSATVTSITGATAFGLAFQPVVDRLRVIDNLASGINNFRLNPSNGALSGVDTSLNFTGLPGGNANAPEVAIAYDRDVAGATATTLFGIVSGGDRLVRQGGVDGSPSPNGGMLFDIGPLGFDTTENAGLDIDPASGEAYAVLQVGGVSGLYRVDLATGAATSLGAVDTGLLTLGSLSIGGPPGPQPPPVPVLESLTVNPTSFRAGTAGNASASAKRKVPVGTTVTYRLSAAATVSFQVEWLLSGRKVGGKCVKKTRANRHRKSCTRVRTLKPGFSHTGAAGENRFKFRGRIGKRVLTPGAYKLVGSVGSSVKRARFEIAPELQGASGVIGMTGRRAQRK